MLETHEEILYPIMPRQVRTLTARRRQNIIKIRRSSWAIKMHRSRWIDDQIQVRVLRPLIGDTKRGLNSSKKKILVKQRWHIVHVHNSMAS
jgi:hypothetical protein